MTSAVTLPHIMAAYPRRRWKELPIAVLQAYVDDSVCQSGDRRLFMAGYIQDAEQWQAMSDEWDVALRDEPAIEYFKMSEAHSRRGQFQKFSESQRTDKIWKLARIIEKFDPWSFHTSVSLAEFDAILKPHLPFPMSSPYALLFQGMVLGIASLHAENHIHSPTRIIFDRQEGIAAKVIPVFEAMFDAVPTEWRSLVTGTPQFEDDIHVLPLQAADMLAWHVRREHEGQYPEEYYGLLTAITKQGVSAFTTVTKVELQKFADVFASMPNLKLVNKNVWRELSPFFQAIGSHRGLTDDDIKRLFGLGGA